ncbi:hypothetical protein Tco_0461964 [Tanacetum coccineum]
MGDENSIRTLGDYSKPSHEGYMNTIELPKGNDVVPLRSDTIRLVQNGCSFHELRSEDLNQHLKDFLKLVDSLDLNGENRERTHLCLFQFSLRDQASNCLNVFQQGESISEAWTHFKELLQKVPHHGIDLWLQVQIFYDHVNPVTRRTIDQSAGGKLRDRNVKESWALLEDLTLYDNETHLAPKQPVQVNKISSSCEICSGPHDTQYCMENPEQDFVDYASSRTDKAGGKWFTFKPEQNNLGDIYNPSWKSHPNLSSINAITLCPKQPNKPHDDESKEEEREEMSNPENIDTTPPSPPDPSISFITENIRNLNSILESYGLVPQSSDTEFVCTKGDDRDVKFIEIIRKYEDS